MRKHHLFVLIVTIGFSNGMYAMDKFLSGAHILVADDTARKLLAGGLIVGSIVAAKKAWDAHKKLTTLNNSIGYAKPFPREKAMRNDLELRRDIYLAATAGFGLAGAWCFQHALQK